MLQYNERRSEEGMVRPAFEWEEEFDKYLDSLSKKDRAKILARIDLVQKIELVDSIRKEYVKKLDDTIYEIRARTDEHWLRGCYFHVEGTRFYITHGFNKKQNKTPKKEITKAKKIKDSMLEILLRRRGNR